MKHYLSFALEVVAAVTVGLTTQSPAWAFATGVLCATFYGLVNVALHNVALPLAEQFDKEIAELNRRLDRLSVLN